ncbi:MAG: hypothetical protein UY50_C0009G0043 [Parcubacteria group bacterium GW2011_GWA2_49_9]|nr:MAG: hypothetical protein UY50_C0009G0043 [Parcubacteria group bacterium GW2011_GWA2_49_9]
MEKWEYKIIEPNVRGWLNRKIDSSAEPSLNELGNQGWELVAITPLAGTSASSWGSSTTSFVLIFKRKMI